MLITIMTTMMVHIVVVSAALFDWHVCAPGRLQVLFWVKLPLPGVRHMAQPLPGHVIWRRYASGRRVQLHGRTMNEWMIIRTTRSPNNNNTHALSTACLCEHNTHMRATP